MANDIVFEQKARKQIFSGIEKVAKAVAVSLGPKGSLAIIETPIGTPIVTKDGVSIAKAISLKDPMENLGASLVKEIASKSGRTGDGTTTCSILGYALSREGLKVLSSGVSSTALRKGIEIATHKAVEAIKKHSVDIRNKQDITNIAKIASNNDEVIGNLISDAFEHIGENGTITVAESPKTETYLEFTEGMTFDNGLVSPHFVTDPDKLVAELKDAYVLVTDMTIQNVQTFAPLLNAIAQSGKPLFIIAEDYAGEVLPVLIVNKLKGVLSVGAVKAPYFGEMRKGFLEDIAILTGASFISKSLGRNIDSIAVQDLGHADKIISSKEGTTIINSNADADAVEARIEYLKKQIEEETSEYTKEKLEERLAKLSGGVCVLNVYADTEPEMKERKDRIEDTLASVRASMKEGIVTGGGVTLLKVAEEISKDIPKNLTEDEKIGYNLVVKALEEPVRQLAINAGLSADIVVNDILASKSDKAGYNIATGKWEDNLFDIVVDPALVETSALQNASSVVGLLLNTEVAITTIKEETPTNPIPNMPY